MNCELNCIHPLFLEKLRYATCGEEFFPFMFIIPFLLFTLIPPSLITPLLFIERLGAFVGALVGARIGG